MCNICLCRRTGGSSYTSRATPAYVRRRFSCGYAGDEFAHMPNIDQRYPHNSRLPILRAMPRRIRAV